MNTEHKTAVVTGGTRGIGLEIARALKMDGYKCAVCSSSDRHDQLDDGILWRRCDVSDAEQVREFFHWVESTLGSRIDVLVNNAGILTIGKAHEVTPADVDRMMRVNFYGTLWCTQQALRLMGNGPGLVVNMLSSSIDGGRTLHAAYTASKAAVDSFTDCLVKELKDDGRKIAVLKVVPRRTWTDMRTGNFPNESAERCLAPDHVAACVVASINAFTTIGNLVGGSTLHVS